MALAGRYKLFITLVFLGFTACKQEKKKNETVTQTKEVVQAPGFNADSAYAYVAKQVAFGPRVPGTSSHQKCGDYIIEKVKQLGWEVTVQEFEARLWNTSDIKARNIIASFNPAAQKRIILAAHWDTRSKADQDDEKTDKPSLQANDGGSGVAVLIEIARIIQAAEKKPEVGVDLIFFDVEDNGEYSNNESWCLGSQYWSKNKHKANYNAYFGILFDMVGAKDARFYLEGTTLTYAPEVGRKVWNTAATLGYGNYFIPNEVSNVIDDHYFVNTIAKIPMVDIIDYNGEMFSPTWHTHEDNMDIIDKNTLKAVGQTALQVVYNE